MTFTNRHVLPLCIAVVLACARVVHAADATITGTVIDPLGSVVADVRVELIRDGAAVAQVVSNERGEFSFDRLPEGRYHVVVTASGFETAETERQFLTATGRLVLRVALQIGPLQQAVVVSAAAAELPQARVG